MSAPLSRRDRIRMLVMGRIEIVDMGYVDEHGCKSSCHIWTGPDSGSGRGGDYPRMALDGQTMAVHKVAWTNEHGIIPGKKQLDHKCHVRRCVRDDHLEMVTHKQNQKRRDKARRKPA